MQKHQKIRFDINFSKLIRSLINTAIVATTLVGLFRKLLKFLKHQNKKMQKHQKIKSSKHKNKGIKSLVNSLTVAIDLIIEFKLLLKSPKNKNKKLQIYQNIKYAWNCNIMSLINVITALVASVIELL